MKEWEYLVSFVPMIVAYAPDEIAEAFDSLGKSGWELVSVDNGKAYFKRPVRMKLVKNDVRFYVNKDN